MNYVDKGHSYDSRKGRTWVCVHAHDKQFLLSCLPAKNDIP